MATATWSSDDPVVVRQSERQKLLDLATDPAAGTYRKTSARIIALRLDQPFIVDTDRGPMSAQAGDYLVTNHPDDDPSSDVWAISAVDMAASYEPA
jgi:hypothetical protein